MEESIPVLQPDRPRGDEFIASIRALQPDISVVVAYGHLLPKDVIDLPRLGTLNIHASLLPLYRGAAPIQAAIRDGRAETGVSIMRMVPALDAGPVILALPTEILPDETAGELELRLAELGAEGIIQALALMELGHAPETPQDETKSSHAAKIEREHARIDWSRPAIEIERMVRAFDPKPGAWTTLANTEIRIFGAKAREAVTAGLPGTLLEVDGESVVVACGQGAIRVLEVHPAGKKRQRAAEWLRGRGAALGDAFSPPAD